jgi:hypothetical protein
VDKKAGQPNKSVPAFSFFYRDWGVATGVEVALVLAGGVAVAVGINVGVAVGDGVAVARDVGVHVAV